MNALLALPLVLKLLLLFLIGAGLGAAVNLAVDRMRYQFPRISPWNGVWDALLRWFGRTPQPDRNAPAPLATGKQRKKGKSKVAGPAPRSAADRIPILGWMRLRREVPLRGTGFWIRPLLVELFAGFSIAWLYWWEVEQLSLVPFLGMAITPAQIDVSVIHFQYLGHVLLLVLMLAATLIDLDEWFIPDTITVPGTLLALVLACWPYSLLPCITLAPVEASTLQIASPNPFPAELEAGQMRGLGLALGCYWLWIFALLPRVWRGRRGLGIAWTLFWRRLIHATATRWLLLLGMAGSAAIAFLWMSGGPDRWTTLLSSLLGLAAGLVTIWTIRIAGALILRREAMGFGDVTLMGMIGAFLGWQPSLMVFFIGPFFGLAPGIAQLLFRRHRQVAIPYGPFLCAGAASVVVFWAALWEWGEHLFEQGWLVPIVLGICAPMLIVLLVLLQLVKRLFRARE